MHGLFSIDDFSEPFWQTPSHPPPAGAMNRSESEWALEKFLEEVTASASSSSPATNDNIAAAATASVELRSPTSSRPEDDVVEIKKNQIPTPIHTRPQPLDRTGPIDSEAYRALLKSKLDLACAVVAMTRKSSVKPEDFPSLAEDQRQPATDFQSVSQPFRATPAMSTARSETAVVLPDIPATQKKPDMQVRQVTSGSSREDSDDEEDEDTETNENGGPTDARRARRMQSNRESARRSRRRKQAQLSELETQVGQLRDERSSLLSRFTDVSKKCDDAAVDNRILKADIETLRAKVKMAEEQVKRVTGLNPLLLPRHNVPSMGMQFIRGQVDGSANLAVPMQPNSNHFFHQPVPGITSATSHLQRLNSGFSNTSLLPTGLQTDGVIPNIGGMTSVQQHSSSGRKMADVPSIQQTQMCSTNCPSGPLTANDSGRPQAYAKDNKKK